MGQTNYANGFNVAIHEHALDLPFTWKKPQTIFVNSMSDLFHKSVPTGFILRVFEVMRKVHWHQYQVLTKRAGRRARCSGPRADAFLFIPKRNRAHFNRVGFVTPWIDGNGQRVYCDDLDYTCTH